MPKINGMLARGDRVKILDGPLAGREGEIALVYPGGTVYVAVDGERNGSDQPHYFTKANLELLT